MSERSPHSATERGTRSRERMDGRSSRKTALSALLRYTKRGMGSGVFAALAALVTLRRLRRALHGGSGERAVGQAMLSVFWIGVAMTQWWSRGSRASDPSVGGDRVDPDHATGSDYPSRSPGGEPPGASIPIDETDDSAETADGEGTREQEGSGQSEDGDQKRSDPGAEDDYFDEES